MQAAKLSSLWLSLAPISCALHCLCLCCFKICFPVCFATLSGKVVWWGVSGTLYWAVQRQQLCRLGWVLSWALLKPCLACTVLPWHDFFFFFNSSLFVSPVPVPLLLACSVCTVWCQTVDQIRLCGLCYECLLLTVPASRSLPHARRAGTCLKPVIIPWRLACDNLECSKTAVITLGGGRNCSSYPREAVCQMTCCAALICIGIQK